MSPPRDCLEARRLRAWELKQQGWQQQTIAAALGVTPGAVSQWLKRAAAGGVEALRSRMRPRPTPRLTPEQRAPIPAVLARGAGAYGLPGGVWTTARVAAVLEREFGVRYHPAQVSRLLRAVGRSVQRPIRRATQRDEAAIAAWRVGRWPALKKGPRTKGG